MKETNLQSEIVSRKSKMTIVLLFILFTISCTALFAVPANPRPVVITQPNGDTLTVKIKGDERINWYESTDGYTLLYNKAGYLSYAVLDAAGHLQPSEMAVKSTDQRSAETNRFLQSIGKKLFYSKEQQQLMRQVWKIEDEISGKSSKQGADAIIGHYKVLCALVQFPEKSMIYNLNDFEGLMNQLGYSANGSEGSVRDFFREVSYGQFDLTITLCNIYTAPNSSAYYAGNGGTARANELARWLAQQVAVDPAIDFADYDSNGDGEVDGFHFIFAGMGQEAGGGSNAIWSHKSSFYPPVTQNGKTISIYSCSSELYTGTTMTSVGVICHEMTHVFGAADYYDTNYEIDGQYQGTGRWDLMANGSWNGTLGGNCPAHPNMFIKAQFGWVTPEVLESTTAITNMPNAAENPVAYRVNTTTPNEYFLLENRQRINFDADIPGDGLIIYRVHSNLSGGNATHPQRMYIVAANAPTGLPNAEPGSYGDINSESCPFPGTGNKQAFTDVTTPCMQSWAGVNTQKPITHIAHTNRLISFNFMGDATPCQPVTNLAVNYAPECANAQLTWSAPTGATAYNIYRNGSLIQANHTSTTYNDVTYNQWMEQTWAVTVICPTGESQPVSITKAPCDDRIGKPRTILLETFISSTCPCTHAGNINLRNVLSLNQGQYALIKYPMDWPGNGDPYYTQEGYTKRIFYQNNSVPHLQGDGRALSINPQSVSHNDLVNLQNVPAFMELDVDYYVSGKTVFAKATVTPEINFSNPNLRLFMAIVEKTTTQNIGPSGDAMFEQIMKKFMPDADGISIGNLTASSPVEFEQMWEFKGNYRLPINALTPINHAIEHSVEDFDNLTIVAWIQNIQDKTVLQACNGTSHSNSFTFYKNNEPLPSNSEITVRLAENDDLNRLLMQSEIFLRNSTSNTIPATLVQTVLEQPISGVLETYFGGTQHTTNANASWQGNITSGLHNDPEDFKLVFYPVEEQYTNVKVKYEIYPQNNSEDKTTIIINYVYANTRIITASTGDNGTITPIGTIPVVYGANQTFTFISNHSFKPDQLFIDGEDKTNLMVNNSYTFTNVTSDHTIHVTFTLNIPDDAFCGGSGTETDPYQICNAEELAFLATFVNAGNGDALYDKYFILNNDIDLSAYPNWVPIGESHDYPRSFQGHFDGNYHVITNLTINRRNESYCGLFGSISNATIQNLGVTSGNIISCGRTGGLVGRASMNSTITPKNTYITNCFSNVNVNVNEFQAGGLVGWATDRVYIANCYATGTVTGHEDIGGLVGQFSCNGLSTISNCYATGNVTGNDKIGGIVGSAYSVIIRSSVAANHTIKTTTNLGTLINRIAGEGGNTTFFNNYAFEDMVIQTGAETVTRSDDANANGTDKDFATLTSQAFYATAGNWQTVAWDITGTNPVWAICSNGLSLPYLNWQQNHICPDYFIVATSGVGGIIESSGRVGMVENGSQTFTFIPDPAYDVEQLFIDGEDATQDIENNSYTFTNVTSDHTIHVTFKLDIDDSAFCGGNGSEANPYQICNAQGLAHLASLLNEGKGNALSGKYFILMNDIDLSAYPNWMPIGRYVSATDFTKTFQGNFNGNHHVITNLTIRSGSQIGLFGYIRGATIQNLGIVSGNVSGGSYVGGLVGWTTFNSLIFQCYSKVSVTGNFDNVGGLVGNTSATDISNSYATGNVAGNENIGGLVGNAYSADISDSYATGNVTGNDRIGGIVGEAIYYNTIRNCVAANHIISSNAYTTAINRITGYSYSTFSNNYAFEEMVIQIGTQIVTRSDDATVNGTGKDLATLTSQAFYETAGNWHTAAWDIGCGNPVWGIYPNGGFLPYLNWQQDYICPDYFIIATSGAFGAIVPNGTIGVVENGNQTFTFIPKPIHKVAQLLINGEDATQDIENNSYTFTNVTNNHTIHVTFKLDIDDDAFCGGDGSETNPYQICDAEKLAYLATFVREGKGNALSDKYFILMNDLDLSGYPNWMPIGRYTDDYSQSFQGNFNGNHQVITNLTINRNSESYIGLFGYLNGATIQNLGVASGNVSGYCYVGGLVGLSENNSNISLCYSKVNVSGNSGSGNYYHGGLVGHTTRTTITNCYATGNVIGTYYVGGLVGYHSLSSTISNCYTTGSVTGSFYVGGIMGRGNANIRNCVAANNAITATDASTTYINRIAGECTGTLSNNYAFEDMVIQIGTQTVTRNDDATLNGTGKDFATLMSPAFYETAGNWDVTSPWNIATVFDSDKIWRICSENWFLPFLQWQNDMGCDFIPITDIINLPTTAAEGLSLTLTGTAVPSNAFHQTITWSVKDAGTTGATITGNILNTPERGIVEITASILNGLGEDEDFTKDFTIVVIPCVPMNVQVGAGTTSGYEMPINTFYNYSYVQHIFTEEELGNSAKGGKINAVSFQYVWGTPNIKNNQVYYLGHTDKTAFASAADWIPVSALTPVFTGNVVYDNANEWFTIEFTEPFEYQGGNLVLALLNNHGFYTSSNNPTFRYTAETSYKTLHYCVDETPINPNALPSGTRDYNRSNILFNICTVGTFIPVTDITNLPTAATVSSPLTLSGTVVPDNATYQSIVWSVVNASTTGATITGGNMLNTTAEGSASIRASIIDGLGTGDYTQDFNIAVSRAALSGTVSITGNAVFGELLTTNTSALTSTPVIANLGTLSYQWKRGTTNIGTNSASYTLVQADINNTITVTVTTANCDGEITSSATSVVTKAAQTAPDAPTLLTSTSTSITLNTIASCEYRMDGGAWQASTTFSGLTSNTSYSFTARKTETATHLASPASAPASFITNKATLAGTVTITGNAVFGELLTTNTSALTSTPVIANLGTLSYQWKRGTTNIGTNSANYTLVQADINNTITVTVTAVNCDGSVTSAATSIVTKAAQTAPAAPTLLTSTSTSITLNTIAGCEYRRDGGAWQASTTFSGLTPNTSYSFTARKTETATHLTSPESAPIQFTTLSIYTIAASVTGGNGTISPSGEVSVIHSANQSFTITPNANYHIDQVLVDGVNNAEAVANGSYTFENVTANHTIVVSFAIDTYTINASVTGGNGTITPNGNVSVNHGANQTFTITPNTGYHILQVLVDGVNNPAAVASGSYTFTNVTNNHTIVANFEEIIIPQPPIITTTELPNGIENESYSATLEVSGDLPITWSTESGSLPVGLILNENSGEISGIPEIEGLYNFVVKATNNAGSDTKALFILIEELGIENPELCQLRIYPNPTTGEVKIENGELKIESVEIFDIYGKNYHLITSFPYHLINISHLSNGIYFLRTETDKGVIMKKIIKN